jgi:DNA-binding PucR family transcriptional regulator
MLTVADIQAIARLRLTVAGGADGLGRQVRGAHTSELDDPTPWLSGGELLLTTGQPLQRAPGAYVERLAGHGLAGLVLGLGFALEQLPAEAAAAADRLAFPVFTTPYEVPFIAITEAVFTALARRRVRTLEEMTELILDEHPLDVLLSELAARAGAALCVRDREGRVLAATAEIDPGGPGVLARDIVTGSRTEAELLAVPGPRFDLELLHHVQTVLAAELLRRRSIADVERRIAGDLVESIMAGEIRPRELRRKAAAFGLGGERPLTFAVLRPQPAGARELAALAERAAQYGPAAIRDGGVAVLLQAAGDDEAEEAAGRMLRETEASAAGVGRVRLDPSELRRSYDEALYAVEARTPNGHPSVATFRDLGSVQLLLALQGERGVELFCESLLGTLIEHDSRHGSELVASLHAYIEANGRWADAAAALSVHRHTLRYRIRKIEELTQRDLSDARDRLELWLALRAWELRKASV